MTGDCFMFAPINLCGYGASGAAALSSLLASGCPPNAITVIDADHGRALGAARLGTRIIVGDATVASTLYAAHIGAAHLILVCIAPDDAAVSLVRLARALVPLATINAAVREADAETLAREAGADTVISLNRLAGRLAAQAVLDEREPPPHQGGR